MQIFTKAILTINICLFLTVIVLAFSVANKSTEQQTRFLESSFQPTLNENELSATVIFERVTDQNQLNVIEADYKVKIHDNILEQLNEYWIANKNNEFGVCADGYLSKKESTLTYVINKIYSYRIGDSNSIENIECNSALGTIHSHPAKTPQWSESDKNAFKDYYKNYKNKIMIIMYDANSFVVYNHESLDENKARYYNTAA